MIPDISFVVITMNRRDELARCLASITAIEPDNWELIVVDNASSDDTATMVRRDFPGARLISNARNLGAGGARNVGIAHARGELIVCMDDDTRLETAGVCARVRDLFAAHPRLGCLCFAILDADSGEIAPRTIPRRDKRVPDGDTLCGHFLSGGCVFRAACLEETGLFWDRLAPYAAEEFDLSFRLLDAGWEILWTPTIAIVHYESPRARPSTRRIYYEVRNRPWVALRYLPLVNVLCHTTVWWGYMFLTALRYGHPVAWARGVLACLGGVPAVWRIRKRVSRATMAALKAHSGPLYY